VTYRASISTNTLARQELVAALEEWPRVHRTILLQGERLSVDDTCPIIIQSLDVEECGPTVMVFSPPAVVTLGTLLAVVTSVSVVLAIGSVTIVTVILLLCIQRYKKRYVKQDSQGSKYTLCVLCRDPVSTVGIVASPSPHTQEEAPSNLMYDPHATSMHCLYC
jgi:hypothetical protein